jgi:hypothetical protein
MRLFLALALMGGCNMLHACHSGQTGVIGSKLMETLGSVPGTEKPYYGLVYSNETPFEYDEQSELTVDSLMGLATATEFHSVYPTTAIRLSEGEYYTVYSLRDGQLAYVVFAYHPYTGVGLYLDHIIVYPYSSQEQEQELWFLLPQDLPEAILGREQP